MAIEEKSKPTLKGQRFGKLFWPYIIFFVIGAVVQVLDGIKTQGPVYNGILLTLVLWTLWSIALICYQIKIGYAFHVQTWLATHSRVHEPKLFWKSIISELGAVALLIFLSYDLARKAGFDSFSIKTEEIIPMVTIWMLLLVPTSLFFKALSTFKNPENIDLTDSDSTHSDASPTMIRAMSIIFMIFACVFLAVVLMNLKNGTLKFKGKEYSFKAMLPFNQ